MSGWHLYWLLWLGVGFMVPEVYALVRRQYKNTLSETVWGWANVKDGASITSWTALHFALLLLMVWLTGHMVWRLWK